MRRSGSRTRATHSGAELSARRSQLATALSSPKPSASSGLGGGSRTLIAFSSSASSHGGSVQRRVSAHSGQNLAHSGSASSMYRSAAGQGRALSSTEQAHLRMLSSRSDSVIHDMAHSSESRMAAQQMSGHALDAPMSIQITPVSSGIESMFESRASRDQRHRGRTRSGEGSGIFLEQQLDDGSLRRTRRQSGSHTRLTRRSLSRSPSSREDNEPLQELVEVEVHGAMSRERTAGSPSRSASFHGSSEAKREAQRQSSSSIAANAMSPRNLLKDSHSSSSSRLVHNARTATSTERTSSTLGTTGNRGALTSSFKTDFESSKRLGSLLDKGRTSPTRLGVTSGVDSIAPRQEHDVLTTSRKDLSGALGLYSSGLATKTATESTKVRSQQQTGTSAIRETAPLAGGKLEFSNITEAAKAEERQKPQIVITTERTATQGPGWSQQTVSSRWKVQETASGNASSETRPDTLAATDTNSGILISSSKQGLDHEKLFSNATASGTPDSSEKTSLMTPSFLQKGTSSKSLLEQSVHRSSLFSDNAPDALTNSAPAPVVASSSLEKERFSKSMTQQSLFPTGISSGMDSDTSAVNAAQGETVAKQETIQQAVIEKTASGTLIHSDESAASLTPTTVSEKTSKSFIKESIHRTGVPSNNITSTSTEADRMGNTLSDSTYQDAFQKKLLDRPALTMLSSSEKSSLFTSSAPAKTSSRTVTQESIRQSTSLDKAAGAVAPTAIEGTILSTSTNQAALHQDVFDKSTAPAMLDLHDRSSVFQKVSSRTSVQTSSQRASIPSDRAPETARVTDSTGDLLTISTKQGACERVLGNAAAPTLTSSTENVSRVVQGTASKSVLDNLQLRTTLSSEGQAVGATVPALEDVKLSSTKQDTLTNLSGATLVTSSPERTSSKSVIQEPMLQTISSTKPPDVLFSAETKDETFGSSAVQDLVQQKSAETESNNYSLSAGAHLITTKKVSTRRKTNEPVQESFFKRIEGSKYHTFDSALRRGQLASSGGKSDFQEFQVTASSEPTQATVEIASVCESLPAKAPQDLSTEYVSADKEKQVGEKAESTTAVALTPLPELSLIGSSPKASSEEIRSSETDRSVSKVADRDDALQWLVTTERHSTRLGEAAALFDAPSDVVQTGHRRSRVEFSESKQMIEQVRQAEGHEGGNEEVSGWKVYNTAMQEGTAPAPVSELLIKPQTAPILYDTEQEERVSQPTNDQPRVDSSLLQYSPDEYILAELVREVERKIEASSRYHVEPLPDDVLTIRSSKGIESLGQLRYETYEEELLMRRSEDDLCQEQKRSTAEAVEQPATAVEEPVVGIDQKGYSGVLEEYYESAEKRQPEPEPEQPAEAGAQPSVDIGEEAKAKVEEYTSAVTAEAQEKIRVLAEEHERREGEVAQRKEVDGKKVVSEKSFDAVREERRRQFEQRWNDVPVAIEREGRTATVQDKETLEIAQRPTLTTAQGETEEMQNKVFVKKELLEEHHESAEKRQPEPEPEQPAEAGAQPSVDIGEEAKANVEEYTSAVTAEAQEKSRVLAEHERREGEVAQREEVDGKEVVSEKSFDAVREERRRQFEQRWNDVPVSIEREAITASLQDKGTLEIAQRPTLTTVQGETEEIQDKVFVKKQQGERTSENAVRRFIAAAIEEATKREESSKSVKRFREYPCSASAEEAPTRIHSGSPDTSATDLASRKEEERRLADIKVQQEKDKAMPQLVRCKSIAELIEQIIQQHVSGTDVHKQGSVHEKQVQAQDFTSAQVPGFPPNMGQQEIPVYYQTGTASQKLGDQYVNDYRFSLLGVPRKSDTQLESTSQAERRFSFSSLGGRGAKCVIRKLEPGALTYLVEVAPADKNQENQTDMVMAEEQMLVSEIFDHITTPNLRVSSSGTRLNEPAPITVSSAASLTTIRNAYAEAVARRVLCKQLSQGTEGVLSAVQKAKFYENRQGMNLEKTASSTSLHSAASVEDYVVQRMIDSGIIRNQAELWGKKPLNFENRIISRTCSAGAFSKSGASSEALAVPPSTPANNVEPGDDVEEGAEYCADAAQDSTAQAPQKEEVPRCAEFEPARDVTAAASNFVESEKQAMAAISAESHEEKRSSTFTSNERSTRESKSTATVKATVTSERQRSMAKQPSAASLKSTASIGSGECTLCTNHISPEKSFESFICFGLHDLPKYFATVPTEVSDNIKLRIATDDDVRETMYLPWKEPEFTYSLHAAIVTRHMLCPSSFFVAVDTLRGIICGAASALMFDEEVAFCGFCHVLENYAFEHVGVLLWNELLHVTSGKNLFTLLSEPAYRELQELYPFPSNPATGILFGPARLSLAAFARTVLVLEYKDKYFDALASYDKHVFGFNRKRYLASTVHEVGLDIRVATRNERNICGYGGMQRDSAGRLVLRWLFADDAATAESLLSSLLSSCTNEDEVEVVAAFFLRSASTRPILDKLSTRQLEPWRLVYTKREPLHSYGRVVCLTTV